MPVKIDKYDSKILAALQNDASLSSVDISDKTCLSSSACWRRITRLKQMGVIGQRVTRLSGHQLGLNFIAYVEVKLFQHTPDVFRKFEQTILILPEVTQCFAITGEVDFMLCVITKDIYSYDVFLSEKLLANALVANILSRIVVRQSKDTIGLPLDLVCS